MHQIFRILRRYLLVILAAFAVLAITLISVLVSIEAQLPDVAVLKDAHMQIPLRIYSHEGRLIAEYGARRRTPVTLEEVPKPLVQAILATEDQRFYSHPGVDFIGLFRAFRVLVNTGEKTQGASTITMQVARNFFLSHKKTYIRKLREIMLALKIERSFSKDKILELYLNKVYFGNHAYGVAAAAAVYYGKTLDQLTLAEMAMIAGMPQAPSKNNPIARPDQAILRRNHVLLRLVDAGKITKSQYQQALHEADHSRYHGPLVEVNAPYIGEMARQFMVQQYGEDVYEQGFSVYTSVAAPLQQAANRDLQWGLIGYAERHGEESAPKRLSKKDADWKNAWRRQLNQYTLPDNVLQPAAVLSINEAGVEALLANGDSISILKPDVKLEEGDVVWAAQADGLWRLEPLPKIQGALITLNPQNGAILALTGGFDFALSEFNRVTQAQRQPGSAFKPFVYSAALEKGFTLASTINDAPVVMEDSGENNVWRPRNDTHGFYGLTRLREGLAQSLNMVSIRLLQAIGIPYAVDYVQRFGFNAAQLPQSLSLALGTGLTSPLSVATGYAVFANGGYRVKPYFIERVLDRDQQVLYSAVPAPLTPAIDPQNAYLMAQALKDVIAHGTGKAALSLKRADLAGKTGTTNDKTDAWFAGFNSQLVTVVWIGYDDLTPAREYGSEAALEIWIHFMRTALAGLPENALPQPPGIVMARIDPKTGLLASPNQKDSVFEVFREGTEPHEQAPVSAEESPSTENVF